MHISATFASILGFFLVTIQKDGVEGAKQAPISASELEANGERVAFA